MTTQSDTKLMEILVCSNGGDFNDGDLVTMYASRISIEQGSDYHEAEGLYEWMRNDKTLIKTVKAAIAMFSEGEETDICDRWDDAETVAEFESIDEYISTCISLPSKNKKSLMVEIVLVDDSVPWDVVLGSDGTEAVVYGTTSENRMMFSKNYPKHKYNNTAMKEFDFASMLSSELRKYGTVSNKIAVYCTTKPPKDIVSFVDFRYNVLGHKPFVPKVTMPERSGEPPIVDEIIKNRLDDEYIGDYMAYEKLYASGRRDFTKCVFDFRYIPKALCFEGVNFEESYIAHGDFSHQNLNGVKFAQADMNYCDFSYSTMIGVTFEGCLELCDFKHANLKSALFDDMNVVSMCDFRYANLEEAIFNSGFTLSCLFDKTTYINNVSHVRCVYECEEDYDDDDDD